MPLVHVAGAWAYVTHAHEIRYTNDMHKLLPEGRRPHRTRPPWVSEVGAGATLHNVAAFASLRNRVYVKLGFSLWHVKLGFSSCHHWVQCCAQVTSP
jgi:hypothetical protein